MTKWKELLISLSSHCRFHEPAAVFQLDEAERQLAVALPSDLRDILRQTNGVEGEYELGLLWPLKRIVEENIGDEGVTLHGTVWQGERVVAGGIG